MRTTQLARGVRNQLLRLIGAERQNSVLRSAYIEKRAMTEEALRILASSSSSAYSRALAALRDDTQGWWQEQLSWEPVGYDEDQTPYHADAENLKRFLEDKVLPWYEKRRRELEHRPRIRDQASAKLSIPTGSNVSPATRFISTESSNACWRCCSSFRNCAAL